MLTEEGRRKSLTMTTEKKSLITKKIFKYNFQLFHCISIVLVILPAVAMGILILTYSVNMPYWDQWNLMPQLFIKISQNSLSWQDLIAQHNESRKLFPRLIFLGLAYLTNWDVRYEMLVIFMLACLVSVNIYRLNRLTVNTNLFTTSLIAFLANILIFSPIQYDNWFWGIQLVVFMPIACITTAISVVYSPFNTRYKFVICMVLCIISTFSYSNGMIAWVIVLPVLTLVTAKSTSDLLKQKWLFFSWIAVLIGNIVIYFYDYQKPEVSPSLIPAFRNPEQTLQFFLAFLGSPLGSGFEISPLTSSTFIGGVEIGIFCCLFIYLIKHFKDDTLVERTIGWIMIAFYTIISALITSVGRVGFGVESALSSKYTTFSLYLIIAIIHLFPIVFSHIYSHSNSRKSQVWFYKVTVAIAIIGLIILHYRLFTYSVKEIKSSYQLRMEGKTCLSFINIIENKSCVEENILGSYDYVKDLVNKLNYLGMLKPNLVSSNNIKAIATEKSPDKTYGSLDGIIPLNSWYFVNGWAFLPERNEPADAIILTYKNQADNWIIFDVLMSAQTQRENLVQLFNNPAYLNAGWEQTISGKLLPKGQWKIAAWAFDTKSGKAYKLDTNHLITKND
ncbi:hypothetical protein [Okeania sp. SIO2B3]|uniref:hypothetical protein n=1 Tax=Okeania sp. SIO2B3 TaxID=2607784 RepID=UPI0013C0AB25|nr:hypothetical protein [Okeania sp. SIO2B3]NET42380.1 hypothetical protein [Okeania sp. SIO2B3]